MRQTPAIWVEPSVDVVEGYVTAVDGFTHAIRSEPACVRPRVLLLDEPFGALDASVRAELRAWLPRMHDEMHATSVFVTHDQEEAMELADRIVLMNRGRVEQAADPRVELLARSLVAWQWPDGGWNCDQRASGRRSSFHESLPPAWGLHEYWLATGAAWAERAAGRAAELFLEHRVVRSLSNGEVIDRRWLSLRYPPYWHYDVLQAMVVLARLGRAADPRAGEALDLLERHRLPDGR
jgi:hypothetical protein